MNLKHFLYWFVDKIYNYNLFIPGENDYDVHEEQNDPRLVIKHQKYSTKLYILLLFISLYILFYMTLIKSQSRTVTISPVTPLIFDQLHSDHIKTLSCPCSTVTMPYETFVSHTIIYYPICTSTFVSQQWIQSFYIPNASTYGVADFRTTAYSQFELLSNLCLFSQQTILQNHQSINNNELISIYLLSQKQIQLQIDSTIKIFQNSLFIRINSFLNYLRITTRANYLVSALNTNLLVVTDYIENNFRVHSMHISYKLAYDDNDLDAPIFKCDTTNPISPVGFFSFSQDIEYESHVIWYKSTSNSTLVSGFFAACTPFEALLQSTLDCLYDIKCLQLLNEYFPILNQMNYNLSNIVLIKTYENNSVNDYLNKLFIKNWSIEMNYSNYFHKCSPLSCTYITTDRINLSYTMTFFISLYSGLIILLRLISPFLINIIFKFKHRSTDTNINSIHQNSYVDKFIQIIKQLNLFKDINKRTENNIKQQKFITRIYLSLLISSILILLLFHSLNSEIMTITVDKPSLITFDNLQKLYSNTIECFCSNMTILYSSFISLSPILHQVCRSDFVSDQWISILKDSTVNKITIDWRNRAFSQFLLLSDLCKLANKTIDDAVHRFLSQSFIVSNVLSKYDFDQQINLILKQFYQSTIDYFTLLVNTVHLLMQVDQPFMGSSVQTSYSELIPNLIANVVTDQITDQQSLKYDQCFKFHSIGPRDINSTLINCICAIDSKCLSSIAIYDIDPESIVQSTYSIDYIVPGSFIGCSASNSLLFSTLECFYKDSDCFSILINYIYDIYIQNIEYPSWFDVRPLISNPILDRYPPNISIEKIIEQVMIEQWNEYLLYDQFYQSCSPTYCTYSKKIRTKTFFEVITTLISIIGGLTLSLRLITPQLVKFIYRILNKNNIRQEEQVHLNWSIRMRKFLEDLIIVTYNTLINLNIFHRRDFGNNIERIRAKHLGQWSTRLYILLFLIGISILIVHTTIQSITLTKTFNKPTFKLYKSLINQYEEKLKCSCSSISSINRRFVHIQPKFHQICLSSFISNEWRNNLTFNIHSNLSKYSFEDYRRFLSSHLQYLQGLCQLSIQSINNSIEQFHSSFFITIQLLTEKHFHLRLDLLIKQSISNLSTTFLQLLFLIRTINHGNAILSTYETNFQYISPWYKQFLAYASTQQIIYENCSCQFYSNCTSQANFIDLDSLENISIHGLKIGCLPTQLYNH
ncbi:hypothetical protein I4U23_027443 [Adineta vaga]|nr:hypothetical protein I4U23_027443 [Adineta vaga]